MSARRRGCARGCLTACFKEGCVVHDLQKGCEFDDAQEALRC
jgi:hypothetical protein